MSSVILLQWWAKQWHQFVPRHCHPVVLAIVDWFHYDEHLLEFGPNQCGTEGGTVKVLVQENDSHNIVSDVTLAGKSIV